MPVPRVGGSHRHLFSPRYRPEQALGYRQHRQDQYRPLRRSARGQGAGRAAGKRAPTGASGCSAARRAAESFASDWSTAPGPRKTRCYPRSARLSKMQFIDPTGVGCLCQSDLSCARLERAGDGGSRWQNSKLAMLVWLSLAARSCGSLLRGVGEAPSGPTTPWPRRQVRTGRDLSARLWERCRGVHPRGTPGLCWGHTAAVEDRTRAEGMLGVASFVAVHERIPHRSIWIAGSVTVAPSSLNHKLPDHPGRDPAPIVASATIILTVGGSTKASLSKTPR